MKKFFSFNAIGNYLVSYATFKVMMHLFGALPGALAGLACLITLHLLLDRFGAGVVWACVNTILAGIIIYIVM